MPQFELWQPGGGAARSRVRDDSVPRIHTPSDPRRLAIISLIFALLARAVGLGQKYLWGEFETESSLFELLLFDWRQPEDFSQRIDDLGVTAYVTSAILAGVTIWFVTSRPSSAPRLRRRATTISVLCLVVCLIWEVLTLAAKTYRGDAYWPQMVPASYALRVAVPLALLAWAVGRGIKAATIGEWILRVGTALTFAGHGLEAIVASPEFTTMVISVGQNLLGWQWAQESVELALRVIGTIDLVFAVAILGMRSRLLAGYGAFWGAVTALARALADGWLGLPETLLRLVHIGAPLGLLLYWSTAVRDQDVRGRERIQPR